MSSYEILVTLIDVTGSIERRKVRIREFDVFYFC